MPYAEDVNYWKTGQTAAETWLDKAKEAIRDVGGLVTGSAQMETADGAVFALLFTLAGQHYRINWPVLTLRPATRRTDAQRRTDERAAKIQAATFLYHDVKAKCMIVKIMGGAAAFAQYALLPDGTTVAEMGFTGRGVNIPLALQQLMAESE